MYMYNGDTVQFSIKLNGDIAWSESMNKLWAVTRWLGHYSFSCVSSLFLHIFFKNGFPPDIHHGNTNIKST